MSRIAKCPNCGAPVELRIGASAAAVCSHCRFALVRTDRDLQAIGKVADLVPTAPELAISDRVYAMGDELVVAGRVQLDHGSGPWDEYYVSSTQTGSWGWLAKAQGQWLLTAATTLPMNGQHVPNWNGVQPGAEFFAFGPQAGSWVVDEKGASRVVSAEGELPFIVRGGEVSYYLDLSQAGGGFATIDFGDGSAPPVGYWGKRLRLDEVRVEAVAAQRPQEVIKTDRLRCPKCGGPIDLLRPESVDRVGCVHCGALLDMNKGALSFVAAMKSALAGATLTPGQTGVLRGEAFTCAGVMIRITEAWGTEYQWHEYLLYSERGGYAWLMQDRGHFVLLRAVAGADVRPLGASVSVAGRTYKFRGTQQIRVRAVAGEFYWKVRAGEESRATEYIAPPYLCSMEATERERNWTVGEYIPAPEIGKAFGLPTLPQQQGVGVAQPNPHTMWLPGMVAAISVVLLILLSFLGGAKRKLVEVQTVAASAGLVDPQALALLEGTATEFEVAPSTSPIGLQATTNAHNQWVGLSAVLTNLATGDTREVEWDVEYYQGVDDGYSWTEGSPTQTAYVGGVPPGRYRLELTSTYSDFPQPGGTVNPYPPATNVWVVQNARPATLVVLTLFFLLIPLGIAFWRHSSFEKARAEA